MTNDNNSKQAHPQNVPAKLVYPVRYSAWLCGELGQQLAAAMEEAVRHLLSLRESVHSVRVTRLPRALLVEADEADGVLLEAVATGAHVVEKTVAERYPVFHHEMGPVWTGTLQVVYNETAQPRYPLAAEAAAYEAARAAMAATAPVPA